MSYVARKSLAKAFMSQFKNPVDESKTGRSQKNPSSYCHSNLDKLPKCCCLGRPSSTRSALVCGITRSSIILATGHLAQKDSSKTLLESQKPETVRISRRKTSKK